MPGRFGRHIAGLALGAAILAILGACTVPSSDGAVGVPAPEGGFDPSSPFVVARDVAFDRHIVSAPLGVAFTLVLRNGEANAGMPHNVSIYRDAAFKDRIVEGKAIEGPNRLIGYPVAALPVGTYYFQCDIHPIPAMQGELHVP